MKLERFQQKCQMDPQNQALQIPADSDKNNICYYLHFALQAKTVIKVKKKAYL